MTNLFSQFMQDESGATAIEYGLIAALISVAIIAGATTLGDNLNTVFDGLGDKMSTAGAKHNPPS